MRAVSSRRVLLVAGLVLSGCMAQPDVSAVAAQRAQPVKRNDLFQAVASNGSVLVAGTAAGAMVTSADAGTSWARRQLPGPSSILSIASCPDGSFAALDYYRRVWLADATAQAWAPREIKTPENLMAIACAADGRLWVVGSRTSILVSADKGTSWTARRVGEDAILTTVQFIDATRGHATGEFGAHFSTDDGGASWKQLPSLQPTFYPYASFFRDEKFAWSAGVGGVLLHTANGGRTWIEQANPSSEAVYGFAMLGETLYAVGAGGGLLAMSGDGWARLDSGRGVPASLTGVAAHGTNVLIVSGAMGALHVISAGTIAANLNRN